MVVLQQRLQQQETFKETEIISWLIDVLKILEYIHDRGIIHRDISPQNLIYAEDRNSLMLIDFSVGKQSVALLEKESTSQSNSIDSWSDSMKVTRTFVNKIGYAPYEQIKLGLAFPCSDLYSLAVTAVVLLTGKQPHALIDWNTLEWQWRLYTSVSEPLAQIINKLLAYNPKHRYQSATEVLEVIEPLSQQINPPQNEIVVNTEHNQTEEDFKEKENYANTEPTRIVSLDTDDPQSDNDRTMIEANETNSFDRDNSELAYKPSSRAATINSEDIQAHSPQMSSVEPQPDIFTANNYSPSPELRKLCQQKLAYYIGPIANLIVEEIVERNMCFSHQEFIEAIATEIPDWQQSLQFQQTIRAEMHFLNP